MIKGGKDWLWRLEAVMEGSPSHNPLIFKEPL